MSSLRTKQGRRTFKHRAAIAWNSLPGTIKRLENPLSFKTEKDLCQGHQFPKGMFCKL